MWQKGNTAGRAQVMGRVRPYRVLRKDGRDILDLTVRFFTLSFLADRFVRSVVRWASGGGRTAFVSSCQFFFICPYTHHYRFAVYTGGRLSNVSSETPPEGTAFRRATLFSTLSHILATRHRVRYEVAFRIRFNRASSSSRDVQEGSEGPRG